MALQHGLDVLHVGLGLVVLGLQVVQLIALLFEEAQNALLLLLIGIKVLQLPDEVGDHIAHLAQILGGHLGQSSLGEIADLLLAGGAILQHLLAVGDIDLFRKGIHHCLLLRGQLHLRLLDRRGGLRLFLLRSLRGGVQRQGGHCRSIEIEVQSVVVSHC